MSTLTGLQSIELIPAVHDREVVTRLQESLRATNALRATVAYWCVGSTQLGPDLSRVLGGSGFLCVDIHLPTDIDVLAELEASGANVYLHLLDPNPQPGELKMRMPPHLMHPKLLIFDYKGSDSELWVGSHNWTARALTGVNIEASLSVRLQREAELYADAASFVANVRSQCVRFDPGAIDYYKWLQGQDSADPLWVVELTGEPKDFDSNRRVTVFAREDVDYKNLRSVDKNIVVSLTTPGSEHETLYEAVVSDTGRLDGSGMNFDARLYAAYRGSGRPVVVGPTVPPQSVLTGAKSWATLTIEQRLVGETFELPPTERWVESEPETSLRIFRPSISFQHWFSRPDRPLVRRPKTVEEFRGRYKPGSVVHYEAAAGAENRPVSGQRGIQADRLIRKKLVRATTVDGSPFSAGGRKEPK